MNMCKIFFPFHYKVLINLVKRKMFKTGYITFTTESLASEEESFDKKAKEEGSSLEELPSLACGCF